LYNLTCSIPTLNKFYNIFSGVVWQFFPVLRHFCWYQQGVIFATNAVLKSESINSGYLPLKTFLYHFSTVDADNDTLKHTSPPPPKKTHNTAIIKVDSYMAPCCRYQIWCARRVSGITLIRYSQSRKIEKSNYLMFWK
jgi:hypothetical protein